MEHIGGAKKGHPERMGEEFAMSEKLGLAPNLWGSAELFFDELFTV